MTRDLQPTQQVTLALNNILQHSHLHLALTGFLCQHGHKIEWARQCIQYRSHKLFDLPTAEVLKHSEFQSVAEVSYTTMLCFVLEPGRLVRQPFGPLDCNSPGHQFVCTYLVLLRCASSATQIHWR